LSAPLFTISILLIIEFAKSIGLIPNGADFLQSIFQYLSSQGVVVVFLLSFIENLIFFGPYLPGSIAILGIMSSTHGDLLSAVSVWFAITIPAVIAQLCNFQIGRRLPDLPVVEQSGADNRKINFIFAYWHPYIGSIASIKSGQSRANILEFFYPMFKALLIWNLVWGVTMYNIGGSIKFSDGDSRFYILLAILWLLYEFWAYRKKIAGYV